MSPADHSIDWRNVSARSTLTPRPTISRNWECRSPVAGPTLRRALDGVVGLMFEWSVAPWWLGDVSRALRKRDELLAR
jgi:hypothetical protein